MALPPLWLIYIPSASRPKQRTDCDGVVELADVSTAADLSGRQTYRL